MWNSNITQWSDGSPKSSVTRVHGHAGGEPPRCPLCSTSERLPARPQKEPPAQAPPDPPLLGPHHPDRPLSCSASVSLPASCLSELVQPHGSPQCAQPPLTSFLLNLSGWARPFKGGIHRAGPRGQRLRSPPKDPKTESSASSASLFCRHITN